MITAWYKHLKDPEQIENFKRTLISSRTILDRQTELLNEMEADLNSQETNSQIYDLPNWDYRQADSNGYRRCLRHIRKLIDMSEQDTPRPKEKKI